MESTNSQRVKSLLLISSSSYKDEDFLQYSLPHIENMLRNVSSLCFIPHAAVSMSKDDYLEKLKVRLSHLNINIESLHNSTSPLQTILRAEAICVGGGNTFALIDALQRLGVVEIIRQRVLSGVPYIGWSAGSNISSPTIGTTNDMPIVEPMSFSALNLVPFQINPHYTDQRIEGHRGESREDRIMEYTTMNPSRYVVGLREGSILKVEGDSISLVGEHTMRLFKHGETPRELTADDDINFIMK